MLRALSSGVSGMINQQLVLDNTGNNLANVTTSGFKGSRVSFSNALIQTEFTGAAPGSSIGGQNPRQVGLGMTTSSIDLDMRQGAIESTGRNLDLAIQGEGFFEVTDGTISSFTRVGKFDFDSANNLVDLGSGFSVIGNTYNTTVNPDGSQSISAIGVPLQIDRSEAFPPSLTTKIDFQGNLSSAQNALQGGSLQSVFPLTSVLTDKIATENTQLTDLSIFKGAAGVAGTALPMYIFGTKPDGKAYGATFNIYPWNVAGGAGAQGTVGELVEAINGALTQNNQKFGTARLDNGNLVLTGVGDGNGFSAFFGEQDPFPSTSPINSLAAPPTIGATGAAAAFIGAPMPGVASYTAAPGDEGLLNANFTMPPNNYTAQAGKILNITVSINGVVSSSINIPAADYSAAGAQLKYTIPSFPRIKAGDVVTYDLDGDLDLSQAGAFGPGPAAQLTYATTVANETSAVNMNADVDADGHPDLFQEGTDTDANAWVYRDATNLNFNWYRSRVTPDVVASSIQVFDAQGGKHTLDARFFRTGTRVDPQNGQRINNWDMLVNTGVKEATLINDVVGGLEFDQTGRFTGNLGTTAHSTTLSDTGFVGNPSAGTVQIDWQTTGPTNPATIALNFGTASSVDGLTGFGSASTAHANTQDGYGDGVLSSMSVSSDGDLVGLYTNGISRKLAQLELTTFRNPGGLTQTGTNLYRESVNSGSATRHIAGQSSGFITSGALEGSNVDIATEFTRIITAQRGFQVNSKVIQTADAILDDLVHLIR